MGKLKNVTELPDEVWQLIPIIVTYKIKSPQKLYTKIRKQKNLIKHHNKTLSIIQRSDGAQWQALDMINQATIILIKLQKVARYVTKHGW